jgi:hypothetical protein
VTLSYGWSTTVTTLAVEGAKGWRQLGSVVRQGGGAILTVGGWLAG